MHTPYRRGHHRQTRRQKGLVLVIALILMAVIGISSSAAIRLALTSNAVALGLRASNEALQRADIALRWCELQTRMRDKGYGVDDANFFFNQADVNSEAMATNYGQFMLNSRPVPTVILVNAGYTGNQTPRCLSQQLPSNSGSSLDDKNLSSGGGSSSIYRQLLVTVRATSSDFREATGGSDGGGEAWLQSTLYTK
jgi:hypothetical protein